MDKNEKNNLKRLNSVLKKNSIIIVVILFLFLACGYFYSYYMISPKYKSTSTILLASNSMNKNSSSVTQSEVTLNKSLISTYGTILKSDNVLEKVIENLNLTINKNELNENIHIDEVKDTQILRINVVNENATEAQKIAKELNKVFIEEIKQIYKMDNINIVDNASFELTPYNINHIRDIIIFFVAGIMFSVAVISIIFFFDTTIKIEQDIEEFVGLNVIGTVPKHKSKNSEELIVLNNSKSVISEALKTIRTNISFTKSSDGARVILFTSCNSGEGKSWITSNMAVAYAQLNQNVIVIDADMRKGRQDKIFGTENSYGLSSCLKEIKNNQDFNTIEKYIKETKIPKVHLMPIGAMPPNPSELLLSNELEYLIDILKHIYDVVIIDGTPCNLVSDSIPISRIADTTILVTESRKTKIEDLRNVAKSIKNADGNIQGVILNKKEIKSREYGKGYYYGEIEDSSKIEIKPNTVKELIENRKKYDNEEKTLENIENNMNVSLDELTEKINLLENKISELMNTNLENYTKVVEDVKKIYDKEIDKNKLAESIKENIIKKQLAKKIEENSIETKTLLDEKIKELNYEEKMKELLNKVNDLENNINNDIYEEKIINIISSIKDEQKDGVNESEILKDILQQIKEIKEEQDKRLEDVNSSEFLQDILKEIEEIKEKQNEDKDGTKNNELLQDILQQIEEVKEEQNINLEQVDNNVELSNIREEIKQLNNKYEKINDIEETILSARTEEKLNILVEEIQQLSKKYEKIDDIEKEIIEVKEEKSSRITEEIAEELRKINDQYVSLTEKIANNNNYINEQKDEELADEDLFINNIIPIDKVKDKMKQQELVINCGDEIEYEQLLDFAVGVYEIKPEQDDLKRRVE